jgi:hypothetical protein
MFFQTSEVADHSVTFANEENAIAATADPSDLVFTCGKPLLILVPVYFATFDAEKIHRTNFSICRQIALSG